MFWEVPRNCWLDDTVVIAATGPSLLATDLDRCRAAGFRLVVIHIACRQTSCADWLFAGDVHRSWAHYGEELLGFPATKIAVWGVGPTEQMQADLHRLRRRGVKILRHHGNHVGLSDDPGVLRGNNSVAQVLSIIHFTGAAGVILLGADMHDGPNGTPYFHAPRHPWQSGHVLNFPAMARCIATMAEPLQRRCIPVVNCTSGSALRCFETASLDELL